MPDNQQTRNLFENAPHGLEQEFVESILSTSGVRIERIVSSGQSSPQGFWYDQDEGEWVVVLQGEALLRQARDNGGEAEWQRAYISATAIFSKALALGSPRPTTRRRAAGQEASTRGQTDSWNQRRPSRFGG